MAGLPAGVHGVCPPGVRADEGVNKSEVWMDSHQFVRSWYEIRVNLYKFMRTSWQRAYRLLPLFILGAVWPWGMLWGRDFHWMMGNETGHHSYPFNSLKRNQKVGILLKKLHKSGKLARIRILHSNNRLTPVHKGYTV